MSEMTGESVVTIKDLWQAQTAQGDRLAAALGGVERTLERLTGHLESIDARNARADVTLADYETRLRSLERWRYALPISALSAIAAAAVATFQAVHH